MSNCTRFVGLDVHKDSITVAVAEEGRGEPTLLGVIPNQPGAVKKLAAKLSRGKTIVKFCYEAGPCGYVLYRQLRDMGLDCTVCAPSLVPRKPGDRVKTDRRDAKSLAHHFRAGDLTPVWVPTPELESIRDLTRAREDMKQIDVRLKQRLVAFLLRNDKKYTGRTKWGKAFFNWLATLKFETQVQQIVFQEYVDAVVRAQARVEALDIELQNALETFELRDLVISLMALRGFGLVTAMTVVAELGDITRFESPKQLMAYVGLVPSEYSSGSSRSQGSITKTGNNHARRVLIEASWTYRFPARKTAYLQRRAKEASLEVQEISWKAQKRLCRRFRHLVVERKKSFPEACTAVARELLGFVWAIAQEVGRNRKRNKQKCFARSAKGSDQGDPR